MSFKFTPKDKLIRGTKVRQQVIHTTQQASGRNFTMFLQTTMKLVDQGTSIKVLKKNKKKFKKPKARRGPRHQPRKSPCGSQPPHPPSLPPFSSGMAIRA